MEDMGYTNMEAVIRNVSSKGLLVKDTKSRASGHSGEVIGTLDSYKLSLLFYLAHVTKNMDAASDDPSEIPPRYYFGGYGNITEDFGVTQPTKTVAQQIFAGERDLDGYVESRYLHGRQQVGKALRELQSMGIVKCVRRANSYQNINSVWILLIGTQEENATVERLAERHLAYIDRMRNKPRGFAGMIDETTSRFDIFDRF